MVDVNVMGTAARVFAGAPYEVAGKTGTAQVFSLRGQKYDANRLDERLRDHSLYIAFAPAENPTLAMAVLVENGGFGSAAAAPLARQVFDYWLLERGMDHPDKLVQAGARP
jgi:penicillin-binding protein 2